MGRFVVKREPQSLRFDSACTITGAPSRRLQSCVLFAASSLVALAWIFICFFVYLVISQARLPGSSCTNNVSLTKHRRTCMSMYVAVFLLMCRLVKVCPRFVCFLFFPRKESSDLKLSFTENFLGGFEAIQSARCLRLWCG